MSRMYKFIFRVFLMLLFFKMPLLMAQDSIVNKNNSSRESVTFSSIADIDENNDLVVLVNNEFFKGNWEAGKKILDEQLSKYPKYSDFHMLLGKYYLHFQNYDKARYSLHNALLYNNDNVEAKQILINVEEQTQRYASAIGYVNELLEVTPYWKGLWRKKIELYDKQGNKTEAMRLRKRILEIYPNDKTLQDDYTYYAGINAREKAEAGDIEAAIKIHKEIVNQEPNNVENYINLVNDYTKSGDLYNALSYTDRGLQYFPDNEDLILKKAGILAEQNRYNELLPFLQKKGMTKQYSYYLSQAALIAKNQEPAVLYGKIFIQNPADAIAFSYVFNDALSKHQYQEALGILEKHRDRKGNSKEISRLEFLTYQKMGNISRANSLVLQLFEQYPDDYDIKEDYVTVKRNEAKDFMNADQYENAVESWKEVIKYGNDELQPFAKNAIYTAYFRLGEYDKAVEVINQLIDKDSENSDLYVKKAAAYFEQKKYDPALTSYEQAIQLSNANKKEKQLSGYSEMMTKIIKLFNEEYKYDTSYKLVKRWLTQDSTNQLALHYAFNLANLTNNEKAKLEYAEKGHNQYPDDFYFTIKLAEIQSKNPFMQEKVFENLNNELSENQYHQELINAFTSITTNYGNSLIKQKESRKAIARINKALYYAPESIDLKYTKGLAFEQLKQFDSAFYYQSFYKPDPMEVNRFKQHLEYLGYQSKSNQIGISHLRSRHGDDPAISTISSLEYTRFGSKNTYTARVNYAGRSLGKGVQTQGEWSHIWNEKIYTTINVAWANKFFPKWNLNGSIFKYVDFIEGMEFELGVGYREFYKDETLLEIENPSMFNIVAGASKIINNFSLNVKYNSFFMDGTYTYNLSFDERYFFASPKNYIMAVAAIGTSPDIELVDYQLYDGFNIFNTMVGVGFGHLLYENVSFGVLGTWYNYKTTPTQSSGIDDYRNLYNIYFNLIVAF